MLPFLFIFLIAHAAQEPFWKTKEKVFERVKNGEIIVAVKTETVKEKGHPPHLMTTQGGGMCKLPQTLCTKKHLSLISSPKSADTSGPQNGMRVRRLSCFEWAPLDLMAK